MTHDEFQTIVGAEPHSKDPRVAAHVAQCPECARFQQELQAMDRLIHRALQIDTSTTALPLHSATASSKPRVWSLAASILVTVSLVAFVSVWLLTPRDTFASQVIDHIHHEQRALVTTSEMADPARVARILATSGIQLKPGATRVSYVQNCWFRGHYIPHLVVQTEQGPVTVLVLTKEPSHQQPEGLDEEGFKGVVLPAPRGVIVVVGQNAPVDEVAATLLAALDYGQW
jgi:hypothetical protein